METIERVRRDLEAISEHVGTLEEAAANAYEILRLPRYTAANDAATALAADIRWLVEEHDWPEWVPDNFRRVASVLYLIDHAGTNISYRKQKVLKLGGTGFTWIRAMTDQLMAEALLEKSLGRTDTPAAQLQDERSPSEALAFRVRAVTVTRDCDYARSRRPLKDVLEYDIDLLAPGPHLLVVPRPFRSSRLSAVQTERSVAEPAPQAVEVRVAGDRLIGIVFGSGQQAGEGVRLWVEHRPRRPLLRKGRALDPCQLVFKTFQAADELVLEVRSPPRVARGSERVWSVLIGEPFESQHTVVRRGVGKRWKTDDVDPGETYTLYGREKKLRLTGERRTDPIDETRLDTRRD